MRVIDIISLMAKKMLHQEMVLLQGKKIARSFLYMIAGIVMINNAFILLALAFYNYLLTLLLSPIASALLSGLFFLAIAAVFIGFAYKTITTTRCFKSNMVAKEALDAFLSGFRNGR